MNCRSRSFSVGVFTVLLSYSACVCAAMVKYEKIPFGLEVLSHCLHEVPSGSHVETLDNGGREVRDSEGLLLMRIPPCDTKGGKYPILRKSAQEDEGLPSDYDGWLQYTALNVSRLGLQGGFDAFTNVMSVPDVPSEMPAVLYLFPGLQNIDWIPKVDPEPSFFDIIQPVLQYPGGLFSHGWTLKSWYVTVNAGALFSTPINNIDEGDAIICNMTRTGDSSFTIVGTVKSSGESTVQNAENGRLKLQPWAYNTLEWYGCDGCATFPTKPVHFTENKLYQNGKLLDVPGSLWAVNPKPAVKKECHERTSVNANGDTTISFV